MVARLRKGRALFFGGGEGGRFGFGRGALCIYYICMFVYTQIHIEYLYSMSSTHKLKC